MERPRRVGRSAVEVAQDVDGDLHRAACRGARDLQPAMLQLDDRCVGRGRSGCAFDVDRVRAAAGTPHHERSRSGSAPSADRHQHRPDASGRDGAAAGNRRGEAVSAAERAAPVAARARAGVHDPRRRRQRHVGAGLRGCGARGLVRPDRHEAGQRRLARLRRSHPQHRSGDNADYGRDERDAAHGSPRDHFQQMPERKRRCGHRHPSVHKRAKSPAPRPGSSRVGRLRPR